MRRIAFIALISFLVTAMWVLLLISGKYDKFSNTQRGGLLTLTIYCIVVIGVVIISMILDKREKQRASKKIISDEEYWLQFYASSEMHYDSEELKNAQYDL